MSDKLDVGASMGKLGKEMPQVFDSFAKFCGEVLKEGALNTKTKELISVGLAVGLNCEYCIRFHVPKAVAAGANRAEILEAAGCAMMMGGGPAVTYAAVVLLEVLDEIDVK
jgi:AhpD family alkylhydroperoxidase